MNYFVIRISTNSEGGTSISTSNVFNDLSLAQAEYYSQLSNAVTMVKNGRLSDGAILVNQECILEGNTCFIKKEEPEEPEEPEEQVGE